MAVEKTRNTVMAIMEESTAGTIVFPSAGTDFIALQDGFSLTPNTDTIDNNELKSSIGVAKQILGLERPEASLSHYIRHSGVEGTKPNYSEMLKAAFGSESANGTQRVTTTGSTVSVVNLAAGGTDFARGKAILLKDGTNGYSIRPVHSVSTNALTLGFDLANAPGSGIGAGKCVNYSPANSGHPTLSIHEYRGNGGAYEIIAGARVSDMSVSVKAGELINGSFTMQGTAYYFDPITITTSTNKLDFTDDDGTFAATIPAGTYRDPKDLATAVQDAMNSANSGETHTVVYLDASGKFKITSTGTVLSLLFASGTNTANTIATKIGFTVADKTGTAAGTGYTSDNAQDFSAPYTPSYDSADPLVAKANEVLIGDNDDISCFCASSIDIKLTDEITDVECVCAVSGVQEKVITRRVVEVDIVGLLERYDADKFYKYRTGSNVRFAFNCGEKSGGNWVAGKCVNFYIPTATITAFELGDENSIVTLNMTLRAYVDSSGNGEFYLNFL